MAIKGLTDAPKAFTKLGQIRKGQLVPTANGNSTKPVDLDYFRVTFAPDAKDLESVFRETYGDQPRRINIRLAFPTIAEVWDANYECYSKGGLIAKATDTDSGPRWVFYRRHSDGEVLVRNGMPVGQDGREFFDKPLDLAAPVYSYKTSKGENVEVFLEPVGRLNVVVPELARYRVGYFEFRPGSPKDIRAISPELSGIDAWAKSAGTSIMAAAMVLTRREETITKNMDGKLSQGTSWLVHIELEANWGGRALTNLESRSLPAPVDEVDAEWEYQDAPETHPESSEPPAPQPAPQNALQATRNASALEKPEKPSSTPSARPYAPEAFKNAFLEAVAKLPAAYEARNEALALGKNDHGILAKALEGILGGPLERSEFTTWLMGKGSTKEMSVAEAKTLLHIMGVKEFDQPPSTASMAEIRACHAVAIGKAA
jgi:hypothetical protein